MINADIQKWAIEMINGNKESKKNLVNYYTQYIINFVETKYYNTNYDKDLLIKAGINGLMESITNYYINNTGCFATNTRNTIYSYISKEISIQNNNAKIIQDLANKMINGDIEAKNRLTNHYINYIIHFVKNNFNNTIYNQEDLIQTGVVFVLDAINKYKEYDKMYFSTYICNYIKKKYDIELKELKKNLNIEYIGLNNNYFNQSSNTNSFNHIENKLLIEKGVKNLSQRNLEILYLHIWKNYAFDELSKIYKVSKPRIQQIIEENKELIKNNLLDIKEKRKAYTKRIK